MRDRVCFAGLATGALLAAALVLAASARAAFPGRDGLLAVQPLSGRGIVLINANGRGGRRVCAQPAGSCGVMSLDGLLRPQWSPDGSTLVIERTFDTEGGFEVIYPDGSCLDCLSSPIAGLTEPAFTQEPTLLTAMTTVDRFDGTSYEALVEYGTDGLQRRVLLTGKASDPVWSSRGELAVVRGGWIWVGSPAKLRRVIRGSAPSWSAGGRRIVFVSGGWLMLGIASGARFRRLVPGAAPAWSPDGGSIAFFDKRHRLSVVSVTGGRVRRVGRVVGSTVDWQPLPAAPPAPCVAPPGSTVLASTHTAIITTSSGLTPNYPYAPGSAEMGCRRANGRERLLSSLLYPSYETAGAFSGIALAEPYAAFAGNTFNSHDQTWISFVTLYDLRTGQHVPDRGGEGFDCQATGSPPCTTVDQLVLGSDGVTAVHATESDANCWIAQNPNCAYTIEQIQASDSTGVHTLDSATEPDGSPPALTDLALTGDTLTWEDNGTQHSAQLQP